jgi:hypothetical protein
VSFDPIRGPAAIAVGAEGWVRVGGLTIGALTTWRVVVSPTTGKPTLFGEGRFLRYFVPSVGGMVRADLKPTQPPRRIGRPAPKPVRAFTLAGKLVELTASHITIAEGEIARS